MNILENTRDTVADLPDVRSKLTVRSRLLALGHVICIALVYWVATRAGGDVLGRDNLVQAATLTSLVFLPVFIMRDMREGSMPATMRLARYVLYVALAGFIFWINDPLWVKRVVTCLALFQIASLLFLRTQMGRLRRENASWNYERLAKSYWFTGLTAVVTLVINEAAIFAGEDWVWIASRAVMVAVVPLSYVAIANVMPQQTQRA